MRVGSWGAVCAEIKKRAEHHCEICGHLTAFIECHEVWHYELDYPRALTGRQILVEVLGICRMCHYAIHIGRTFKQKEAERINIDSVIRHYLTVTERTPKEMQQQLHFALRRWHERSKVEWTQDFSRITRICPNLKKH